jgi:hypothetical protein
VVGGLAPRRPVVRYSPTLRTEGSESVIYLNAPLVTDRARLTRIGDLETYRERKRRAGALSEAEAREIAEELRQLRSELGMWGREVGA